MSIFNEIQEPGLNQILTRRLDIKGDVPSPACVPEIGPVLTLENDRPEWGWLKGERLCARYVSVAPVALQFGAIQLALPVRSTELVTIEQIVFTNANSVGVAEGTILDGGLVGWVGVSGGVADTRWPAGATALQLSTTTNVAQPSRSVDLFVNVTQAYTLTSPIIISPGQCLFIYANAVNTNVAASIFWRERSATASELG